MTWRHPCWAALGIEPTADQRAIRVAYTRKLKAIDPENDPQAFIALREAYERAQQQAEWVDLPDEDDESDGDDAASPALYEEEEAAGYAYSPITGARVPINDSRPDPDAPWRALHDLLLPDGTRRQPPFDEAWQRELGDAIDAVLADPRLEQVGFQADADRWLAELLARAWPASDAILLRLAKAFGWDRRAEGSAYQSPAIDYINARLREADPYGAATAPEITAASAPAPSAAVPPAPLTAPLFEPEWRPDDTVDVMPESPDTEASQQQFERSWRPVGSGDLSFGPSGAPSQTSSAPQPSPWTPLSVEAHAEALAALLHDRTTADGSWPTAAQREAMLGHWRAITADPRMQDISLFDEADRWFANQISRAIPWSDPLVIPATEFFGWMAQEGTIRQDWARDELTRRYRTLKFMAEVEQPGHPLNPAWRDLVTPGGDTSTGRVPKAQVRELLTRVREEFPDLEGCFDADRLAHWERRRNVGKASGGRGSSWSAWIFPILFAAFLLIRAFTAPTEDRSPPVTTETSSQERGTLLTAAPQPLGDRDEDLDRALLDVNMNLDMAKIGLLNAPLAKTLARHWDSERKRGGSRATLGLAVRNAIDQWLRNGYSNAAAPLLKDYFRLQIETAGGLKQSPEACLAFLKQGILPKDPLKTVRYRTARQKLEARVVLEMGEWRGDTPSTNGRFSIPGGVYEAARKRAGLSDEAMSNALMQKGSAKSQCDAHLALYETVVNLPDRDALKLLRRM